MKPTRRTELDRLLASFLSDGTEKELDGLPDLLRRWAFRLEAKANTEAWGAGPQEKRGGRPRPKGWLAEAEPNFEPFVLDYFTALVQAGRRFASTKNNPATFRRELPSGRVLIGPLYAPTEDYAEAFRARYIEVVLDRIVEDRDAAAQLALWYGRSPGSPEDSVEEAQRLIGRLKKQGRLSTLSAIEQWTQRISDALEGKTPA